MPVIAIRSLPLDESFDYAAAVAALCQNFSDDCGIDSQHVSVTWELIPAGHYAVGGVSAAAQAATTHPILVRLLAPDFNDDASIEIMLNSLADRIAQSSGVHKNNVFVHAEAAQSGRVLDAGAVVTWS